MNIQVNSICYLFYELSLYPLFFLHISSLLFLYHKSDFLTCLIVVSVSCLVFSNRRLFWTLRQLNLYEPLPPEPQRLCVACSRSGLRTILKQSQRYQGDCFALLLSACGYAQAGAMTDARWYLNLLRGYNASEEFCGMGWWVELGDFGEVLQIDENGLGLPLVAIWADIFYLNAMSYK